jgi:NADP-reducing hydrogenase subunit HndD
MGIENKPGGCRICVVEIEGRRNLAPSCITEVQEGMVVNTHNIRVINARRTVLELIISDHPFDCLVCAKSGQCELQHLATQLGIREIPYKGEQSTYRKDTFAIHHSRYRQMHPGPALRNDVQSGANGRSSVGNQSGFMSVVAPAFEMNLEDSPMHLLWSVCFGMSYRSTHRSRSHQ